MYVNVFVCLCKWNLCTYIMVYVFVFSNNMYN